MARHLSHNIMSPQEIFQELDKYVISQDYAKRTIAIAAYNHLKRIFYNKEISNLRLKKSNILMVGPSGSGKTHIARTLANILNVPFTVIDITEYTEAGYYGKDVEVMIGELLFRVQGDVEIAKNGIIFIDEIDKIGAKTGGARTGAGSRDIGGEGVQQSLLRILEGEKVFVPMNVTQHWNYHDLKEIDVSNILFIAAGCFYGLNDIVKSGSIGFGGGLENKKRRFADKIKTEDLIKFGMLPELLGRLPVVVTLDELNEKDLVHILTEPPDAIIKEYKKLLSFENIELNFNKNALMEIVHYAKKSKLGARGLRSILEDVMHDLMFEAPEHYGKKINITKKYVHKRLGNY